MGGHLRLCSGLALAALLGACGGGGDGSSGESPAPPVTPPGSQTSVSLSRATISITDTPSSAINSSLVRLDVRDPPAGALFITARHTGNTIDHLTQTRRSDTRTDIDIEFKPGAALDEGEHEDTVTVDVCYDEACERPVDGSPLEVDISFTVITPLSVSLADADLDIYGKTTETFEPFASAQILFDGPPVDGPFYRVASTKVGIVDVSVPDSAPTGQPIDITFRRASVIGAGVYEDDVTIQVCYDSGCTREVQGSPLAVHTRLTVLNDAPIEADVDPLTVATRIGLTHDVVDAEYSRALDAIVMVATWPRNALYVYDTATGTEHEMDLGLEPAAISIAPDGLSAAVGHDSVITHVTDLSLVDQVGAPAPRLLHVSAKVHDLVLDGHGYVHVFPEDTDASTAVHTVEVATDTEQLVPGLVNRGAQARLDASGNFLYDQDNGFSELQKIDVATGTPALAYFSTTFDTHRMCTGLWMGEAGDALYTGCGVAVSAAATQAQDMAYIGTLDIAPGDGSFHIRSLSDSAGTHEIVTVETPLVDCFSEQNYADCYAHVAFYDSGTLARSALRSIPPVTFGDERFAEHGLFVFHRSDGSSRYLISRLSFMNDRSREYYLSTF